MVWMHHLQFVTISIKLAGYDPLFANRKLLACPTAISAKESQRDVIALGVSRKNPQWGARTASTAMIHDGHGQYDVIAHIGHIQRGYRLAIGPAVGEMVEDVLHALEPKPLQRLGETRSDTLQGAYFCK